MSRAQAGATFSPTEQQSIRRILAGQSNQSLTTIRETDPQVTTQANRTGELSEILEVLVPANTVYIFPAQRAIQLVVRTKNSAITDGTSATREEFSLSADLVNVPWISDSPTAGSGNGENSAVQEYGFVLYDTPSGSSTADQVQPNALDYAGNTFDYEDAEVCSTLKFYYPVGESTSVVGRAYTQNEQAFEQVLGESLAAFHLADILDSSHRITFNNNFALAPKEKLKLLVNSPIDFTGWDDSDAYPYFNFPVYKVGRDRLRSGNV